MAEMIRSGTTCFVEPGCMWLSSTIKAIEETGMRATTGSWVWDHAGPDGHKCPEYFKKMTLQQALDLTESNIKSFDGIADGRIKCFATIEGVGTCSDDLMLGAKALADKYGTFTLMHKASSREEVASELKVTGHRPVEHMYRIGSLGPNVYLNHMTAVEAFEVDMLAETDTKVCQNPPAALEARQGHHADEPLPGDAGEGRHGVPRLRRRELRRPQGHVPLHVSCRHVAQGRQDRSGGDHRRGGHRDGHARRISRHRMGAMSSARSRPARRPISFSINIDRPEWVPTYNYVYSLVYTASGDSVDTTIVDGRILMENRAAHDHRPRGGACAVPRAGAEARRAGKRQADVTLADHMTR